LGVRRPETGGLCPQGLGECCRANAAVRNAREKLRRSMEDHRLGSDGESKLRCQSEQAIAVKALVGPTLNFIQLRSDSRQVFVRFGGFRLGTRGIKICRDLEGQLLLPIYPQVSAC